jgi:dsRNA-specific ribonuclease
VDNRQTRFVTNISAATQKGATEKKNISNGKEMMQCLLRAAGCKSFAYKLTRTRVSRSQNQKLFSSLSGLLGAGSLLQRYS